LEKWFEYGSIDVPQNPYLYHILILPVRCTSFFLNNYPATNIIAALPFSLPKNATTFFQEKWCSAPKYL
jgi:hypothetical protein